MSTYHIAQVNIGRIRAPLDDPLMAVFVNQLAEINSLADADPGFVWRRQTDECNATYFRPYDDDPWMLLNMSVWSDVTTLRRYVYQTAHRELLRERHAWFEKLSGVYMALWWVPAGHIPGIDEAKKRLAHLEAHGPTQYAFTFQRIFEPDDAFQHSIDWARFTPCPAT